MKPIFITSAVRTPVASFQGGFADLAAPRLGAIVIKEALIRSKVAPEKVGEVIMGEVLTAGVGQAPARPSRHLRRHSDVRAVPHHRQGLRIRFESRHAGSRCDRAR